MMNKQDIILKAESLRRMWGVDNFSPLDIVSMAMENIDNLTILWFPMEDELSGCCTRFDESKIICINSKHSKGRQNFTIAHELYHLIYEDSKNSFVCNINSDEESEKNANKFASHILIPSVALGEFMSKNNISNWELEDVIKCEQYFQISHTAMLCKLRYENLIDYKTFSKFKNGVKKQALNLGYDIKLYGRTNEYFCLGEIIPLSKLAYEKNKITKGKYDEILLNVFRGDIVYNLVEEEDIVD